MDVNLNLMFLGWRSGKNEDGSYYYQGQFLDTYSNQPCRLYFKSDNLLKTFKVRSDVTIKGQLYINSKGLWAIKVVE